MCLAIPGRLIAIQGDGDLRLGQVDFGGVSRDANLAFVPEAVVGDYVLVHVGFAIALIDEEVAKETLEALTDLENQGQALISAQDKNRGQALISARGDARGNQCLSPISRGRGR